MAGARSFTHLTGLHSYCKGLAEWSPLSSCVSDHLALEAYTVYYPTLYRVCQPTLAYPDRHGIIHPLLCFSLGFVCGLRVHISNNLPMGVDAAGAWTTFEWRDLRAGLRKLGTMDMLG